MKVLVTGIQGQLGFDVCKNLHDRNVDYIGVDIQNFDITNRKDTFDAIMAYTPDAIVHCAAYTAVDKAESSPDLCQAVNVDGTRHIALAARYLDAKMIYISTDYVFDGKGDIPYEVDARIKPLNVYGLSKARGESEVIKSLKKYFIVRTSWAFGVNGNNFVKTMMRLGSENESLNVVNDQIGSPTYTYDLAQLLCDMLQTKNYGLYHATNQGYCSRFEFAKFIMEEADLGCKILPISSCDFPTPAQRPLNSRLSPVSLDNAGFRRLPPWQDAVKRYITLIRNNA